MSSTTETTMLITGGIYNEIQVDRRRQQTLLIAIGKHPF